jgi:RimJ/RimL family protein N-acetyltransferase
MEIRKLKENEVDEFERLRVQIDGESEYMVASVGERKPQPTKILADIADGRLIVFVALVDGEMVGFLGAQRHRFCKIRHTLYLFMGVLATFHGRGIGTALLKAVEKDARDLGIHRLELKVFERNQIAVGLYLKCGFVREGVERDSVFMNGVYSNSLLMGKILD